MSTIEEDILKEANAGTDSSIPAKKKRGRPRKDAKAGGTITSVGAIEAAKVAEGADASEAFDVVRSVDFVEQAAPVEFSKAFSSEASAYDAYGDAEYARENEEGAEEPADADSADAGNADSANAGASFDGGRGRGRSRRHRRTVLETGSDEEKDSLSSASSSTSVGDESDASEEEARAQAPKGKDKQYGHGKNRRGGKEVEPSITKEELAEMKLADLRDLAAELEVDYEGCKKAELVDRVFEKKMSLEGFADVKGVLDIMPNGYGFLRTKGYLPSETDVYVDKQIIRRNGLRKGDFVEGQTRPPHQGDKWPAVQKVYKINGMPLEECQVRPKFADLTPIYPDERLVMEHGKDTITARVIDLCAPIGKGQRGLIVSPPKAGKTTILKDIAASIAANNPEVHLMCLLVDERPEEVTDMERSIHGEVISSTFDMPCENHIAVAELVIERAKRLVENGKDVVILLDSITRLARAYNLGQPASGRVLSGGVDSTALYPPKRFLGAARNIENGGSLTILASALIDTGSKMDEVIFEEFKGTGNMELRLDRGLADRRIFPAIDPVASGTRKEELLIDPQWAPLVWAFCQKIAKYNDTERAMEAFVKALKQTRNNEEFLLRFAKIIQGNQNRLDDNLEI